MASLKCFYTNARSIRNNFNELQLYMTSEDLDIVVITESWINETLLGDRIQYYDLAGYDKFVYQRKERIGGGVLIYDKKTLGPFEMHNINSREDIESLWIDIFPGPSRNVKIRLGAFYRPPNQSRETDLAMIDEIERGIINNTVLLGDFNLRGLLT